MSGLSAWAIKKFGLKGSWKWAVKQMLKGSSVTFDRPDGTPVDLDVYLDLSKKHSFELLVSGGSMWFKEQTTWKIFTND